MRPNNNLSQPQHNQSRVTEFKTRSVTAGFEVSSKTLERTTIKVVRPGVQNRNKLLF